MREVCHRKDLCALGRGCSVTTGSSWFAAPLFYSVLLACRSANSEQAIFTFEAMKQLVCGHGRSLSWL